MCCLFVFPGGGFRWGGRWDCGCHWRQGAWCRRAQGPESAKRACSLHTLPAAVCPTAGGDCCDSGAAAAGRAAGAGAERGGGRGAQPAARSLLPASRLSRALPCVALAVHGCCAHTPWVLVRAPLHSIASWRCQRLQGWDLVHGYSALCPLRPLQEASSEESEAESDDDGAVGL